MMIQWKKLPSAAQNATEVNIVITYTVLFYHFLVSLAFTNVAESTNGSNDTYTPPILQPTMVTSKPCLVVTQAYRVYKTIDERIDQIAIESINIANVDVYVWSNDTRMAQYESYSSEIFAETYLDVRFKYIGNTGKGTLH